MARGGGKGRNYTRDASGRFSSSGGGSSSKRSTPASRRTAKPKPKALGGTLTMRSRLRAAKAKLTPGASSQQRSAATKATNNLKASRQSNRRRMAMAPRSGMIRPGKGRKQPPSTGPKLLPPAKARLMLPPARGGKLAKRNGASAAVRAVAAAGVRTYVAGQMARAKVDQAVTAMRKRLGGKGRRKR